MLVGNIKPRIDSVVHFDYIFDNESLKNGAEPELLKSFLKKLKPCWNVESIRQVHFQGGFSNSIFAFYDESELKRKEIKSPGETTKAIVTNRKQDVALKTVGTAAESNTTAASPFHEGSVCKEERDIILLRIYGKNTDSFIDREQELWNHKELFRNKLATRLFFTFTNGYCYQYLHGHSITPQMLKQNDILYMTARLVARIHAMELSEDYIDKYNFQGTCFKTLTMYMNVLEEKCGSLDVTERFQKLGISLKILKEEMDELEKALKKIPDKEVAFCHNDLNCPNLIFQEEKGEINCIDYEYASPNYIAYDIGNLFDEFPGNTDIDFNLYPSRETQLRWIKCYLQEKKRLKGEPCNEVTDASVRKLYVQVNKFALISHLLWGVWAILQSFGSDIESSFISYSSVRFVEYFKRKDEFLSLEEDKIF